MASRRKPPAKARAKKRAANTGSDRAVPEAPQKEPRPGLPSPDSVIAEVPFETPTGKAYRILKTNETDAYDRSGSLKAGPTKPDSAVPPPDRPFERTQQTQATQDFGSEAQRSAELRRKALDDARALPQSDDAKPPSP